MSEEPSLCVELAFPGEESLVYGPVDELPELVRAMLGPGAPAESAESLTMTFTRRALAELLPADGSAARPGDTHA